ncbi:MAG: hypothetical protein LBQ93_06560 [Treponema sp.]|jgi:hypothetical protein|nr:hypothetical protein [Treponema sp.]
MPSTEALSFEKVWAMLQEQIKEDREQMRQDRERSKEDWERSMKEWEQIKEQMKETDRRLGKLGNRLGEMVEYTIMPCLIEKFRKLGFVFTEAYPHAVIDDEENDIYAEIDITLKNGDKVMIVEVKNKLTIDDINEHIERMKKVRVHADLHNDKRIYLGAIGGIVINKNEKLFALKSGFYVVEPSGETFDITVPDGIYSLREWS